MLKKKALTIACVLLLVSPIATYAEEVEIPPVALDAGIVNRFNRDLINEIMEEEIEPKEEGEGGEIEAPKFELIHNLKKEKFQNAINKNSQIVLDKVVFSGNTVFKDSELIKYFDDMLGKKIYVDETFNAISEINKLYEESGYYTSYAFIPEQDVKSNVLVVKIVEGKIGKIEIEGNKYSKDFYIKNIVLASDGVSEDKILNINNINKSIEKIESGKYMTGKVIYNKGNAPDDTNITLKVSEKRPIKLKFMWDNDGNEAVGQNRALFLLSKENLFGLGHQIYGGTVLAKGTTGVLAGYKMPINKYGTELQFDYSFTHLNLLNEYADYKMNGTAQTFSTRIVQPLYDKNDWEIKTDLGVDLVHADASGYFEEENRSINDYTLTVLRHGVNATKFDKHGVFTGRVESSFGLPILGGKDDGADYFNNDTGNPQSAFYKLRATLLRLQKLPNDCLGIVRITGQYTPQNLYLTEQMNFGGLTTMRGFEPGETLADMGVNGTFEIRTPIPFFKRVLPERYKHLSKRVNLGFFYDWGVLSNQHTGVKMNGYSNFLESVGCGIHIKLTENLTASWDIGMPIGSSEHRGKEAVSYFTVKADLWNLIPTKRKFGEEPEEKGKKETL